MEDCLQLLQTECLIETISRRITSTKVQMDPLHTLAFQSLYFLSLRTCKVKLAIQSTWANFMILIIERIFRIGISSKNS